MKAKYGKLIWYIFSGVVTTAVNFLVYFCMQGYVTPVLSTVTAWIVSVLAAYILNSRMVFDIRNCKFLQEMRFFGCFILSRLFSGFVEVFLVFIFIEKLQLWAFAVKCSICLIVVVLNYILSRGMVFRKGEAENDR